MRFACLPVPILLFCLCATALPQDDAAGTLAKAHNALAHDRFADAVALLEPMAQAKPPVKGALRELGYAYYRSGKLPEAEQSFTKAVQQDASDSESVQMTGLTLYRMGRYREAIPYLERVRQWMPNANADANYVLGLCYLNAQQFDQARHAFAIQFHVDGETAQAYLLLAQFLLRAHLDEQAALQAGKALELNAALPLAHFLIGEVELAKARSEDALHEFELEQKINPGYATLYERIGDAYSRLDRLDEAQQALTRAIALEGSSTGPYILMGKVLLRRNDPTTALLYLRRAEKMDPNNAMTHILLGQAYARTGHADEAKTETELGGKLRGAEIGSAP